MNASSIAQVRSLLRALALFRRAFGKYNFHLGLIVVCALLGGIFEAVGISAIVPIFSFIGGGGGEATDFITRSIQWLFSSLGISYKFRYLLGFVAILFLARIFAAFFIQQITVRIVAGYERDIRTQFFSSLIHTEWSHMAKQKVGALTNILIQNTTYAAQFFNYFSLIIVISMKVVAYSIVAINVTPMMAFLALGVGVVQFAALKPIYSRGRAHSATSDKNAQAISHFVAQQLNGLKSVKTISALAQVDEHARELFEKTRIATIGTFTQRGITSMATGLAALGFIGVAFWYYYFLTPGFTMAAFIVAIFAVNQIFTQLQMVQTQFQTLLNLSPYLTSLFSHLDDAQKHAEAATVGGRDVPDGDIVFTNVSFAHGDGAEALSQVSFTIHKGELVGIIGPSGAGKTTVADLLVRLYKPKVGSITVGGTFLEDVGLDAWRANVGYVTQDMFLTHDTLANNIAFFASLSREEVVAAAKMANIHDYIETLPKGYETIVGDRGVLLSGGQRQRIVLARCLARKPRVLILDEATSALDAESERAVKNAIDSLRGSVTIIVIAHRLSTIADADLLIALEQGSVVEVGKPEGLLKDKSSYFYRASTSV